MADFKLVKSLILQLESGHNDTNTDLGGETMLGISKRQYPDLDLKNLTIAQGLDILKRDFWDKFRIGEIEDQDIANCIFMALINIGNNACISIVQNSLNIFRTIDIKLKIDGVLGTKTLEILNNLDMNYTEYFLNNFKLKLISYYLKIADTNILQRTNFRGWVRRVLLS